MRRPFPVARLVPGILGAVLALPPGAAGQGRGDRLPPSDLPAGETVVCNGGSVQISGRRIVTGETAVVLNGCRAVISNSHILAGEVAIVANVQSTVTIDSSFIQGADEALQANLDAVIEYRNSTIRGGGTFTGGAELVDRGGSTLEPLPAPSSPRLSPGEPLVCRGRGPMIAVNRLIQTDGDGLVVEGQCQVLLSDSHVVAGGHAVRVSGDASVRIRNSTLEGERGAIAVSDRGRVHVAGTNIRGRISGAWSDGGGNAVKE